MSACNSDSYSLHRKLLKMHNHVQFTPPKLALLKARYYPIIIPRLMHEWCQIERQRESACTHITTTTSYIHNQCTTKKELTKKELIKISPRRLLHLTELSLFAVFAPLESWVSRLMRCNMGKQLQLKVAITVVVARVSKARAAASVTPSVPDLKHQGRKKDMPLQSGISPWEKDQN